VKILGRVKHWAKVLRRDLHATWLAARDPRVPWHAKAVALFVTAYAFSPIDLIPDFVPVLGYLDDLVIVPIGLWLAIRLIPPDVMKECRAAAELAAKEPVSKVGAAITVLVWLMLTAGAVLLAWKLFPR
jgi:uncharacterized membrane protein YkvA (DUF1232 family)